jgi:sulfur-oxidizing protein SoxX
VRTAAFLLLCALAGSARAADAMPEPLAGARGDPARLCLLCHSGPFPEERFQGAIGPALDGVGARVPEGELRLRLVDPAKFNPQSIMPAYFRSDGLTRVAASYRGKPLLDAQQVEDVVAFLGTLR